MENNFQLPGKIEKILASLSVYYKIGGEIDLNRLIVNSTYNVVEEWTSDNWDGSTYGHAITFQVPAEIYYQVFDNLAKVAENIGESFNKLSSVPNEYIAAVFLELKDDPILERWRENSGELINNSPIHPKSDDRELSKVWTPGLFRLFISHKAEFKKEAVQLKNIFFNYGVSCFIAHEDIEPTKDWQNEIEKALFSMDTQLVLLTEDFSDSNWTDQEIGVALGREIWIIPVRIGKDPYGFIGKFQGLSASKKTPQRLVREIYELLWSKEYLRPRLTESLILSFEESISFEQANTRIKLLDRIESATPELIDRLENAPKVNGQVKNAFQVEPALTRLIKRLRSG